MMIKSWVRNAVDKLGYEIRNKSVPERLGYDDEDAAIPLIERVTPYTMLSRRRLVTLYQQVAYCESREIPGAFVECGVWKGGAVALMALANLKLGKSRREIHLFDAFTEICEPDAKVDGERAVREVKAWSKSGGVEGNLTPVTGIYDSFGGPGSVAGNRDLLERQMNYDSSYLHFHVGWFQDTLPTDAAKIGPIAILRLDGDWYASTKVCLDYLYDSVVKGGVVIIDDYGAYEGCRKAVDEFRAARKINEYFHQIDEVGRYWIKS